MAEAQIGEGTLEERRSSVCNSSKHQKGSILVLPLFRSNDTYSECGGVQPVLRSGKDKVLRNDSTLWMEIPLSSSLIMVQWFQWFQWCPFVITGSPSFPFPHSIQTPLKIWVKTRRKSHSATWSSFNNTGVISSENQADNKRSRYFPCKGRVFLVSPVNATFLYHHPLWNSECRFIVIVALSLQKTSLLSHTYTSPGFYCYSELLREKVPARFEMTTKNHAVFGESGFQRFDGGNWFPICCRAGPRDRERRL